jgi:hypothetical protein
MQLNILHVRAALAIAGVVVLIGYLASGGSFGSKSTLDIEFGMYPEEFEGLEVEIDGAVVGRLERFGQATRTRFAVGDGRHTVRVLHPELASREKEVTTGAGGRTVMMILDIVDMGDGRGGSEPTIVFQ